MKKSELRQIIKEEIKILLNEGTRSRIGMANPDGSITSIYAHWDGYLDGVGKTLKSFYRNPSLVKKLISLGDLSNLEAKLDPKGKHDFETPEKGVTVFYGRDRGESGTKPEKSRNIEDFVDLAHDSSAEFIYLFDPKSKKWLVTRKNAENFKSF